MQQIIVYVDQGVDGIALKATVKTLQQEAELPIRKINAQELKTKSWEKETAMLVIPGGRDLYYHAALDGEGTAKIRRFVEEGGAYLGICAGAYFGASSIEFEKGGRLEICGPRSLAFFPGEAVGPAYGRDKYQYGCLDGLEAAHISWKENSFHAYFNGGCHFAQADNYPGVKVLSSYLDLDQNPAAVIACSVGKGIAVLSGVHLEYSAEYLHRNNPYIERVYGLLENGENQRSQVVREILAHLNIDLKNR